MWELHFLRTLTSLRSPRWEALVISMHIKVWDDLAYETTNIHVHWVNCGDFFSSKDHNHQCPTDSDSIQLGRPRSPDFGMFLHEITGWPSLGSSYAENPVRHPCFPRKLNEESKWRQLEILRKSLYLHLYSQNLSVWSHRKKIFKV